jgi:hypothetical protein
MEKGRRDSHGADLNWQCKDSETPSSGNVASHITADKIVPQQVKQGERPTVRIQIKDVYGVSFVSTQSYRNHRRLTGVRSLSENDLHRHEPEAV